MKHKTGKSLHNSCYRFMSWRKTNRTWCSCISTNVRRNYDALWSSAATRSRAWPWRIKPITACLLDYALFSVSAKKRFTSKTNGFMCENALVFHTSNHKKCKGTYSISYLKQPKKPFAFLKTMLNIFFNLGSGFEL